MEAESQEKKRPDPLWFGGRVDYDSVNMLARKIEERIPEQGTLDVIISSLGGYSSLAIDFGFWLSRLEGRERLRAIAGTTVVSAGLTLFLGFDRRTAIANSVLRFHHLSVDPENKDPLAPRHLKVEKSRLIDFVESRTKLTRQQISYHMRRRTSLRGDALFQKGLCNEKL